MRTQTYGDKQREAQQRRKQEALLKKTAPEASKAPVSNKWTAAKRRLPRGLDG
jgi:hypothetical protein